MLHFVAPRSTAAWVFLAAMAMVGCAPVSPKNEAPALDARATGLVPQRTRFTDERLLSDRQTIAAVQQRLRALSEAGVVQNSYSLAKAQCWLDTAQSQYQENDRTGYIEESLTEAVKIAQSLEADKTARAGYDTPLVAHSSKIREDLWAQLSHYKRQAATLVCNARTVACAEVRLVRAGHADEQTGWRQAAPYVQMVEDALRTAKIEADSCASPKAGAPVVGGASGLVASTAAAGDVTKERYVLLTDTLFKFDKSGMQDMTPGGLQRLRDVAQRLKAYKSIQTLTVTGYTDRLGTEAYNDQLSGARAKTVQAYLESLGVKSASAVAQGKGKHDALSTDCGISLGRALLIQCLQTDRRVTIEITGIAK